jgi:hypothetical protein
MLSFSIAFSLSASSLLLSAPYRPIVLQASPSVNTFRGFIFVVPAVYVGGAVETGGLLEAQGVGDRSAKWREGGRVLSPRDRI